MNPNYENYSLEQLLDVKRVINKEKYPERYEEILALIADKKVESHSRQVVKNPSAKKLHSPLQVFVGSYWGGPLYAVYSVRKNFIVLGHAEGASKTLAYGSIFIVFLLVLLVFIPGDYPNIVIPIIYCSAGKLLVEKFQLNKAAINESTDFVFESNWKIFGLGFLFLIAFLAMCIVEILVLDYSGLVKIL